MVQAVFTVPCLISATSELSLGSSQPSGDTLLLSAPRLVRCAQIGLDPSRKCYTSVEPKSAPDKCLLPGWQTVLVWSVTRCVQVPLDPSRGSGLGISLEPVCLSHHHVKDDPPLLMTMSGCFLTRERRELLGQGPAKGRPLVSGCGNPSSGS